MIAFPNIDPVALSIEVGVIDFALTWYSLSYIAGILIGWWIAARALARPALWGKRSPVAREDLADFVLWVMLGIMLGGRLGYAVFYDPEKLSSLEEFLAVWNGGMSFHGGFIGAALAATCFVRRYGGSLRATADLLALAAPAGLLLGRLANFINAELWGRPTDAPWGVIFPGTTALCDNGLSCSRHPTQLYEAGLEGLLIGIFLLGLAFGTRALAKPGLIAGLFLTGYGAARVFVEIFRQADAQFITAANPMGHVLSLGPLGFSMGQLLSLPMILLGIGLLANASRSWPAQPTPKVSP